LYGDSLAFSSNTRSTRINNAGTWPAAAEETAADIRGSGSSKELNTHTTPSKGVIDVDLVSYSQAEKQPHTHTHTHTPHHHNNNNNNINIIITTMSCSTENLAPQIIARIMNEIRDLVKSPPDGVEYTDVESSSVSEIHALITGPEGTPFAGGKFRMKLCLSQEYPSTPPRGQ